MSATAQAVIRVPGGTHAPSLVRSALERQLADRLDAERLGALRLLATEVVTNSVCHGGVDADGWVCTSYALAGSRVRVEVRDSGGQREPSRRAPDYENGGGFGLFLVDQIASRWGVEKDPGVCVWFELD